VFRASIVRSVAVALAMTGVVGGCAAQPITTTASVVTFEVADGSRYKVLLTDPADLTIVAALADGRDAPSIPNGRIVHETGVNTDWSWSIDPADFDFVDVTDGSCDGTPQEIEDGTFEGDRFCPWSAIVVAMVPAT
jgi:hypothetical protein